MTPVPATSQDSYVLTLDGVRRAITALKPLTIHETFPVYLHLRRRAHALGRFTDLQPDWQGEPHDWLDVPGGPANKPNFRPFTSRGSSMDSFWMNANLAGSYAPSSLRGLRSLYVDSNDKYILPTLTNGQPDAAVVKRRLLFDKPVPAWAVSAFLFRNRRFASSLPEPPAWPDLLDVFQDYFGWTTDERVALFDWVTPDVDAFEVETHGSGEEDHEDA